MNALSLQIPSKKEYFLREKSTIPDQQSVEKVQSEDEQSVASNSSSRSSKSVVKRSRKHHTEPGPEDTKSKEPKVSSDSVREPAKVEWSNVVSESNKDGSAGDVTKVVTTKHSKGGSQKTSKVTEVSTVNTSPAGEVGTNTNTNKKNVNVATNRGA